MPPTPLQQLATLSGELGNPGAAALYTTARKRKIEVSRAEVKEFVSKQGQKQLFAPVQPAKGKSATEQVERLS